MNAVLIPAAGVGSRLGQGPKAWLRLGDQTLLEWVAWAFADLDEIWVALPPGPRPALELPAQVKFLPGGENRRASVWRLLQATQADLVLVHDVARPLVVPEVVARVLQAAREVGAASPVIPVADSLVRLEAGGYGHLEDRASLRLVQTPQAFQRQILVRAHREVSTGGADDAELVRGLGLPVALVAGDPRLYKLTYPADLQILEALSWNWKSGPRPRST